MHDDSKKLESRELTRKNTSNDAAGLAIVGLGLLATNIASRIGTKVAANNTKNRNEQTIVVSNIDRNDKVHSVRIKASWLVHGGVSAPVSVITCPTTLTALTHHWVEIKVTVNKWYTLQISKTKNLRMKGHSSEKEAD